MTMFGAFFRGEPNVSKLKNHTMRFELSSSFILGSALPLYQGIADTLS